MQRLPFIILIVLLLPAITRAQQSWHISGKSLLELKREQQQVLPLPHVFVPFLNDSSISLRTQRPFLPNSLMHETAGKVPKAYQYRDLAFFCRIEVQMEHLFKFPVKFRLGEVQYVERKEGKY